MYSSIWDLRLPSAGSLIGNLMLAAAVGDDLRHQRRVLGRDRLVGEVDHLGHPEDALVVADPLLHVAELRRSRRCGRSPSAACRRARPGPRRARRSRAGRLPRSPRAGRTGAACRHRWRPTTAARARARPRPSAGYARRARRASTACSYAAAASGTLRAILWTPSPWRAWWLAISSPPIRVPVSTRRIRPCSSTCETRSRRPVSRPCVGGLGEAVRAREEIRRLGRVADVELDVVDAVDRHAVVGRERAEREPWLSPCAK